MKKKNILVKNWRKILWAGVVITFVLLTYLNYDLFRYTNNKREHTIAVDVDWKIFNNETSIYAIPMDKDISSFKAYIFDKPVDPNRYYYEIEEGKFLKLHRLDLIRASSNDWDVVSNEIDLGEYDNPEFKVEDDIYLKLRYGYEKDGGFWAGMAWSMVLAIVIIAFCWFMGFLFYNVFRWHYEENKIKKPRIRDRTAMENAKVNYRLKVRYVYHRDFMLDNNCNLRLPKPGHKRLDLVPIFLQQRTFMQWIKDIGHDLLTWKNVNKANKKRWHYIGIDEIEVPVNLDIKKGDIIDISASVNVMDPAEAIRLIENRSEGAV